MYIISCRLKHPHTSYTLKTNDIVRINYYFDLIQISLSFLFWQILIILNANFHKTPLHLLDHELNFA